MKRRDFLKTFALGIIGTGIAPDLLAQDTDSSLALFPENLDDHLKDYLQKMKNFDEPNENDLWIDSREYNVFESVVMKLRRLQELVGYANFQLLSFDDGLRIAGKYSQVGKFSREQLQFMEKTFYAEAHHYGFTGQKSLIKITDRIEKENVVKIPNTGNYLFKGTPLEIFRNIKKQIGANVILTSGVRGIMKQFLLFLNKTYKHDGNLSLASRSLAPPGYSFHGNGDFDVGQVGFGVLNFTQNFATTEVYKKLSDLGYLKFRYPENNLFGVRYEPWHIKTEIDVS